jgi:signal transduction histidine kinase
MPASDYLAIVVEDITDLVLAGYTDRAISLIALAGQSAATVEDFDGLCARAMILSGFADRSACLAAQPESRSLLLRGAVGFQPGAAEAFTAVASDALAQAHDRVVLASPLAESGAAAGPASVLAVPMYQSGVLTGAFLLDPPDVWPAAPNTHTILEVTSQSRLAVQERQSRAAHDTSLDAHRRSATDIGRGVEILERRIAASDPDQPLPALFSDLMSTLASVVTLDRAALCEEVPGRDAVTVRARYAPGDFVPLTGAALISSMGGPATQALHSRRVVTVTLSPNDINDRYVASLARAGYTKWCGAPLLLGDQLYGALTVARKDFRPHFSSDDLRVIRAAATLLALYLHAGRTSSRVPDFSAAEARARDHVYSAERNRTLAEMMRRLSGMLGTHIDIAVDRLQVALEHTAGTPAEPYVVAALDEAAEGAEAMRRLRLFGSRSALEHPSPVAVGEALRAAVDQVLASQKTLLGDAFAAFDLDLDLGEPVSVLGDHALLVEAFSAILNNAFESMPRGGPLTISVAHNSRWVRVLFTDTGVGIAPSVWHQIYDPFFTTRGGLANGLGLSFVDGILAQHGGSLLLSSDVRFGSTFAVYLPLGPGLAGPHLGDDE